MSFRPGWFAPDHETVDRALDEIACPDIHGTEPAGRPLKLRPHRMRIHVAESSAPGPASALLPSARLGAEPSSSTSGARPSPDAA